MKNKMIKRFLAIGVFALIGCESKVPTSTPIENPVDLTACRDAAGVNTTALYTCDEVATYPNLGIPENTEAECGDGLDNDLDGLIDWIDPDCAVYYGTPDPSSSSEITPPVTPAGYAHGILPATKSVATATELYNFWISKYFELDGSGTMARIKWDEPELSVSEGTGYGMLITLFAGDQVRFNQLMNYAEANKNVFGILMWKLNGFNGVYSSQGSDGGASDADLDVATSLILAYYKWNDPDYLNRALAYIAKIKKYYFGAFDDPYQLCISEVYCKLYNPSYFSPVAFRLFSIVDSGNANFWLSAVNSNYKVILASQGHGYYLYPNWTDEYGTPNNKINSGMSTDYNMWALEAVRVPWRLAWDYAWFGEVTAKASLDLFSASLYNTHGGNVLLTGQRYRLSSGTPAVNAASPAYAGAMCVAATTNENYQGFINDCYPKFNAMRDWDNYYFHTILKVMYSQFMSGLYVKPAGI